MADGDYERPRTAELARLGRIIAQARRDGAAASADGGRREEGK